MPAAAAIASMLAAPMPCCSNTSAAASNSFSFVSSRVGRVRTLDMRREFSTFNSIHYCIELHRRSAMPDTADRPQPRPGQQLLPGRHVARLPRGSLSLLRALPRPRAAAAGRRHDLVRAGPCRRHGAAAPSQAVDRRIALLGRDGQEPRRRPVAKPAVHGSARPYPPARPGRPRLHAAPHRGAARAHRDHRHRAGLLARRCAARRST